MDTKNIKLKVFQSDKPWYKRVWVYFVLVFILLIMAGVGASISEKTNPGESEQKPVPSEQPATPSVQEETQRKNAELERQARELGKSCTTESKTTIYQPDIFPKPHVFKDAAVSDRASTAVNMAQEVFKLTPCETFIANLRYGNLGGSVDIGALNLRITRAQYDQAKSQAEKEEGYPGVYLLPHTVTHVDPRLEVSLSDIIYIEP